MNNQVTCRQTEPLNQQFDSRDKHLKNNSHTYQNSTDDVTCVQLI